MRPLLFVLMLVLAGCSTAGAPPAENTTPPPVSYRAAVADSVRQSYFDPYSIRDADISAPLYARAVFDGLTPIPRSGWIVCVKANAKNRMGAYIGRELTVFLFKGPAVDFVLSGPEVAGQVQDLCRSASFTPFPEIEAAA